MAERNIEDFITYDSSNERYPKALHDLYHYYRGIDEPIGFETLVEQQSCGMRHKEDFLREDGRYDLREVTQFSKNVLQLWNTNVSPEPYMRKYATFHEAAAAYAEDTGIASSVDAYLSGVPIEDLLA